MKKAILVIVVLLVLAAIIIASITSGKGRRGERVYAEAVESRDITEVVKASGEVDARVKVNISSHLIGKIEKLYVEEGDEVEAGQPFLDLEKEAFVAARDDWASRLAISKNDVEQARVALADSELRAGRARKLTADGILTTEQLEAAELALTSSRLRLERSEETVRQVEANLIKARDDLRKTTLYAPLAGRVVSLRAEEGEVVVSGTMNNAASVIGTIADLSEILAVVDVDETEIANVRLGQEATLVVDALPEREFNGRVVEVGNSGYNRAQQQDVTFFQVKLLFAEPDPSLRPGMSVRADIRTDSAHGVLVVPIQAVVERPPSKAQGDRAQGDRAQGDQGEGGDDGSEGEEAEEKEISVVFVIDGGVARQQPVETGLSDDTHVAILRGLEAGQKVVTGPYRILKDLEDGDAVEIRAGKDGDKEDEEEK